MPTQDKAIERIVVEVLQSLSTDVDLSPLPPKQRKAMAAVFDEVDRFVRMYRPVAPDQLKFLLVRKMYEVMGDLDVSTHRFDNKVTVGAILQSPILWSHHDLQVAVEDILALDAGGEISLDAPCGAADTDRCVVCHHYEGGGAPNGEHQKVIGSVRFDGKPVAVWIDYGFGGDREYETMVVDVDLARQMYELLRSLPHYKIRSGFDNLTIVGMDGQFTHPPNHQFSQRRLAEHKIHMSCRTPRELAHHTKGS